PPIDKTVINKIFDPFFTTKSVGKGTGLGLSIAHGIITNHNGSISADNTKAGVVFYVQLPVHTGALAGGGSLQCNLDDLPSKGKKILLAEDNEGIQELMARLFQRAGHELKITLNGEEALKAVQNENFDLIISDLKMPVMDGMMFYEKLINVRPEMEGKFILMTGMIGKELLEFAEKNRIYYLQKPFKRAEFNRLIFEIFSRNDKKT
ncbi:MAG: response regulator, partial [Nitrospinota bacterium]